MKTINIIFLTCLLFTGTLMANTTITDVFSGMEASDSSVNEGPIILNEFPLEILAPSTGVQFYKDGIVFLSTTKSKNKMTAKHLSFGVKDAYYAIIKGSTLEQSMKFSPSSVFSYPAEALTFSSDFQTLYFTMISEKDKKEKIYHAQYSESVQDWQVDIGPMDFCENNIRYTHPSLSADGEILIFASDKPGEKGGMDLFFSRKEGSRWYSPVSLGSSINTNGNELFPFLDQQNNLFFSSDGLPGFGGYDVYCAKFNKESWDAPINLTKRINSNKDEMAFNLDKKDEKNGFITIKENSSRSELKLYKLGLSKEYQEGEMNIASLLVNLALLEGGSAIADLNVQQKKLEPKKSEPTVIKEAPKKEMVQPLEESTPIVLQKKEIEPTPEPVKKITLNEPIPDKTEPIILVDEAKAETELIVEVPQVPAEKKNTIIYRVQFASSTKSKGSYTLKIGGKDYQTWEYLYKGAYRSCVGDFQKLSAAKEMQTKCRQSGYTQAFAVVFVNDERSLDRALFR